MTTAPKRGRPRKAALEGAQAVLAAPPIENLRKGLADPVPGDNGEALARIAEYFRKQHPDEWEKLRLCPLQHGLEDMERLLNG